MPSFRRPFALGWVLAGLSIAIAGAVPASAAQDPVIKQCQTRGQLTQTFSVAQLRHALAVMPTSVKEYTNCPDVINQALIVARHSGRTGGAGSGSGGSFLPTPVIVILVLLILAVVALGVVAWRRRRSG